MENKIIYAPKTIVLNSITSFIRVFNFVFTFAKKEKPNYHFVFKKVERCDATGVLLLYKMLEYTVTQKCFFAPTHDIQYNECLKACISEYGFSELIKSLMKDPNSIDLKPYKRLKVAYDTKVLIAPIALIRSDSIHSTDIIKNQYVPTISSFYSDVKVQQMILGVFTEIMHNFWAHATSDSKSIIFGYGTQKQFEIVCCDNGLGIDGTMRSRFQNKDSKKIVVHAMKNGVTSKNNTSHMGYGLWFVNEVVSKTKGTLTIVSNDVLYRNEYGKVSVANCPMWKGCVVSIKLPLEKPVTISDINTNQHQEIKIAFI